jgi:hypothetical protein
MDNEESQHAKLRSWERTIRLMDRAWTREEIEEARAAAKAHLAAYPEDVMRDIWHGWGGTVGALEEREEESRRLGLSESEHQERDELLRRTYVRVNPFEEPDALERIARARVEIQHWLERYPTDMHALSRREHLDQEEALTQQILDLIRSEETRAAA